MDFVFHPGEGGDASRMARVEGKKKNTTNLTPGNVIFRSFNIDRPFQPKYDPARTYNLSSGLEFFNCHSLINVNK